MLEKTTGIVLNVIKYNDNSKIIHIYTRKFGRLSFIVSISSSKKSLIKNNLFQVLNILDIEFLYKAKNSLQRIKEIKLNYPYKAIPFDFRKTSIAVFLSEILNKTLKEENSDDELFNYLYNSLIELDSLNKNISIYHFYFLIKYTKHLGFEPLGEYNEKTKFFDLIEGEYVERINNQTNYLTIIESQIMWHLSCIENLEQENFIIQNKSVLLDKLIKYFQIHIQSIGEIKSIPILKEIFQ